MQGPVPSNGNSTPPSPSYGYNASPFQGKAPSMTDLYSAMAQFQQLQQGQRKPPLTPPGPVSVGGADLASVLYPQGGMPQGGAQIGGLAQYLLGGR